MENNKVFIVLTCADDKYWIHGWNSLNSHDIMLRCFLDTQHSAPPPQLFEGCKDDYSRDLTPFRLEKKMKNWNRMSIFSWENHARADDEKSNIDLFSIHFTNATSKCSPTICQWCDCCFLITEANKHFVSRTWPKWKSHKLLSNPRISISVELSGCANVRATRLNCDEKEIWKNSLYKIFHWNWKSS